MVSSSNSIRKRQSLARVAVLGAYAGVDQLSMKGLLEDPAERATTPLTALEKELRGKASNDSIGAVVATRPDAVELTKNRERRRSNVSASSYGGTNSRGQYRPAPTVTTAPAAPAVRGTSSGRKPRTRRTSLESHRSQDRASSHGRSVSAVSSARYSSSSSSPPLEAELADQKHLLQIRERQRAETALYDGGSSAVVDDSDYGYDSRGRRRSTVLRPTHGNTSSSKAKSEAGYYPSSSSRDKSRRQSRAYPPMLQSCFNETPQWAADTMKGVNMGNDDNRRSSSSYGSHRYDNSSRRSSTATVTAVPRFMEQEPKTPTAKSRSRKHRSAKSVSGATDNKTDDEDARSVYSGYSTATYSHYPRYDHNPYDSVGKRTSWRASSGVDSSRARDLAAAAEQQRNLDEEQERERERRKEQEQEKEREYRRLQKQRQRETLRVDSTVFEMCIPSTPDVAAADPVATGATATATPKSAGHGSPIYDLPSTKSRRTSHSSRPTTAIYSPSQEPASSFNVIGVYRTETLSKNALEPVGIMSKSDFLEGEVYDNSRDHVAAAAAALEGSSANHDHRSRSSRQWSRDVATTATTGRSRRGSRASSRSISPLRIMEAGTELKNRMSVAMHDFKEDQKARAGIIPPDPKRVYPSYYTQHHRERSEHRDSRQQEPHPQQEGEERYHRHRRTRRSSLQQQQQPQQPAEVSPSPSPPSASQSSGASFAGRMALADTNMDSLRQQYQRLQNRTSTYRPEMASDSVAQLKDVAPITSRRDQERHDLFYNTSRRGGSSGPITRRPVGGGSGSDAPPAIPTATAPESSSTPRRPRAREDKVNEQGLHGLDFGFGGENDKSLSDNSSVPRDDDGRGGLSRLDSLYLPRHNNAAASAANAAVPESHRQSFFVSEYSKQQQQQQHPPLEAKRPSSPNPAPSVVSDFSFVAGQPEKLDVPQYRPRYAPYISGIADDRRALPSQSPSPRRWEGAVAVPARGG
ncbi:hypothetical protein PG995_000627 [Apiospora arundinis]